MIVRVKPKTPRLSFDQQCDRVTCPLHSRLNRRPVQHIVRRLLRNTLKSIRRTRYFISDSHNIPEGFTLFLEIKYYTTSINSAKGWDIFFREIPENPKYFKRSNPVSEKSGGTGDAELNEMVQYLSRN